MPKFVNAEARDEWMNITMRMLAMFLSLLGYVVL